MRKFKYALVAGIIICATAFAFAAPAKKITQIDRAEDAVRSLLIDPDSAKFDILVNPKAFGGVVTKCGLMSCTQSVCGHVNSKNRMGGYAGPIWFFVTKEMEASLEPMDGLDSYDSETKLAALRAHQQFLSDLKKNCFAELP